MLVFKTMLESQVTERDYDEFAGQLRTYIAKTLHSPIDINRWVEAANLPTFLSRKYGYYSGTVAEIPCLFVMDQSSDDTTPGEVVKHINRIARVFNGIVVYAPKKLSADRRGRLILKGLPFVVPGNQLYLPQLAVDLREHFHAPRKLTSDLLTPVAQALLFHYMLRLEEAARTPSRLAKSMYYSAMSVGRAFDELQSIGLATVEKSGRTKQINFVEDRRALLELARPYLRNPVRSHKFAKAQAKIPGTLIAGETALAKLTNLAPPNLPTYAIQYTNWRVLMKVLEIDVTKYPDAADFMIEFWHYDPTTLTRDETVDPLSLYAQFWDHNDERVASAAKDLLEYVPW